MYFENQLRRAYDLEGVPIRFVTRKKGQIYSVLFFVFSLFYTGLQTN